MTVSKHLSKTQHLPVQKVCPKCDCHNFHTQPRAMDWLLGQSFICERCGYRFRKVATARINGFQKISVHKNSHSNKH